MHSRSPCESLAQVSEDPYTQTWYISHVVLHPTAVKRSAVESSLHLSYTRVWITTKQVSFSPADCQRDRLSRPMLRQAQAQSYKYFHPPKQGLRLSATRMVGNTYIRLARHRGRRTSTYKRSCFRILRYSSSSLYLRTRRRLSRYAHRECVCATGSCIIHRSCTG